MVKYDIYNYPKPFVTVDVIIFTIIDDDLKVLLVQRGKEPFKDMWAVPGGFVHLNESLENATRRELEEETGLKDVYLEQLYTFGKVKRDPRGRVITISYFALVDSSKVKPRLRPTKENLKAVKWHSIHDLPKLAFDHDIILEYALKRLRYKLEYTAVGLELLPDEFTLTGLQKVYEVILGDELDKRNFRKKVFSMEILAPTKRFKRGHHRPAQLYRFIKKKPKSFFKAVKFES